MKSASRSAQIRRWCSECQKVTLSWWDEGNVERCSGHEKRPKKSMKRLGEIEDAKAEGTLRLRMRSARGGSQPSTLRPASVSPSGNRG